MYQGLFGFTNKRYEEMFMEIQGLWNVVVKQFGNTISLISAGQTSLSIETYATKTIQ